MNDCIFCKIVKGEAPSHKIWEDDKHLAFLTIFPNTQGFSVVITKDHYPSDIFKLPKDIMLGLTVAAKNAAAVLEKGLDDVGRVGMIFEGFGADHAHAKLFPMPGTKMDKWEAIHSDIKKYFKKYEGYISSHDYDRADDAELAKLSKRLRGE